MYLAKICENPIYFDKKDSNGSYPNESFFIYLFFLNNLANKPFFSANSFLTSSVKMSNYL